MKKTAKWTLLQWFLVYLWSILLSQLLSQLIEVKDWSGHCFRLSVNQLLWIFLKLVQSEIGIEVKTCGLQQNLRFLFYKIERKSCLPSLLHGDRRLKKRSCFQYRLLEEVLKVWVIFFIKQIWVVLIRFFSLMIISVSLKTWNGLKVRETNFSRSSWG